MKTLAQLDGGSELNITGSYTDITEQLFRDDSITEFNGWLVDRRGAGAGYTRYNLVLVRDGLRFLIGKHFDCVSTPDARLIVGYSWQRKNNFSIEGLKIALEAVSLFINIEEHSISRLDVNVTTDQEFQEVASLVPEHLFSRGRQQSTISRRENGRLVPETIEVGNNEIKLVIYDKARELFDVGNEVKKEDLIDVFGQVTNLTRFEWRLRRKFLIRYDINTVEDLERSFLFIAQYCTEWARFQKVLRKTDNNKIAVLDWWLQIREALVLTEHNKHYYVRLSPKIRKISGKYLTTFRRAISTFSNSVVSVCKNYEEAIEVLCNLLDRNKTRFEKSFEKKRKRFCVEWGIYE